MARGRKREIQAAQQEREREREHDLDRVNLNGQFPEEAAEDAYQSMLQDLAEADLHDTSEKLMKSLLSKDLVLANLTKAELNEFKWWLHARREMFYAMHPTKDCLITGDLRAMVNDDREEDLGALTNKDKWRIDNTFQGIWQRATRSLGMKQQEMLNTNIRESRVDRGEREESSGGIIGKIRR